MNISVKQVILIILGIASAYHVITVEKDVMYIQDAVILYGLAICTAIVIVRLITSSLYRGIVVALIMAACVNKYNLQWSTLALATIILMF